MTPSIGSSEVTLQILALVRQIFETESPDGIVNFAAETHVDRSLLDSAPFVRTNIEGVRVLLEVATQYGIKRFLQVSTDEVLVRLHRMNRLFPKTAH